MLYRRCYTLWQDVGDTEGIQHVLVVFVPWIQEIRMQPKLVNFVRQHTSDTLTMKCKFSKSCVFFSFSFSFRWWWLVFLGFFDSRNSCFSWQDHFPFVFTLVRSICVLPGFLEELFRLDLKKCHNSVMITEFSVQKWSITMIKIIERTNKFVFAKMTWD